MSSPSNEVKPKIAFKSVVFPAPLGPMSPTMRPGAMVRLTLFNARVLPNFLVNPRASMQCMSLVAPFFVGCIRRNGR